MHPIQTPLADAARRLHAETVVAVVAGLLLAATLIAAFVLVGTACPGARHGVAHVISHGCEVWR